MFKKLWGNIKKFVQAVIKIIDGLSTIYQLATSA